MTIFDRFRLDGKRLFITGGSRGLGREMALAIADAGADVVLVGRNPESLEKTADDIRQLGRVAEALDAQERAVGMATEANKPELAEAMTARLELFKQERPYRDR